MLVALTMIVSLLAAVVANNYAATTSIVRHDSIGREWWRRTVLGTAAMVVPWAAYFLIGSLIELAVRR
jgi:hypothetical protein